MVGFVESLNYLFKHLYMKGVLGSVVVRLTRGDIEVSDLHTCPSVQKNQLQYELLLTGEWNIFPKESQIRFCGTGKILLFPTKASYAPYQLILNCIHKRGKIMDTYPIYVKFVDQGTVDLRVDLTIQLQEDPWKFYISGTLPGYEMDKEKLDWILAYVDNVLSQEAE